MMSAIGFVVALSLSQAASPATTGRVAGRVLAEGVNTPIAGARIMLFPDGPLAGPIGMPPQALTDQSGGFVFERVVPGDYRVEVQKAGFAPLHDPTEPPKTITVTAGQSLDNVDFRLQKGGAIAGRVVDTSGEPVAEVSIVAMRRFPESVDADRFLPAPVHGGQQTNDLGEFRLFGLAPGEYLIAAMGRGFLPFGGPGIAPPAASNTRTTTVTTYYPGTIDQNAAAGIVVAPGGEVDNIVFTLQTVPAFNVAGVVVDEAGSPVAYAMVMLMGDPRSGMLGPRGNAQSQEDGRFVIDGVPAGTYSVTAAIIMTGGDVRVAGVADAGSIVTWSSGAAGGSGSAVAWSSIASGGTGLSASGPDNPPAEVVVVDADVENVRVISRRPLASR
jgi:hypothetical protein